MNSKKIQPESHSLTDQPQGRNISIPPMGKDPRQIVRERYRVFIEDVADGFYEVNLNGDFIFFNEAFCRFFGYACDDMQNRNFREFMDQNYAEIALEHFKKIYLSGEGFTDIIWEIVRKNGEKRILKISANLIFDDTKQKAG
ncbi:PAS domain S-box protein, partial [Thermodesulfobacteriota bacterium]